jgi:FtsP/CotA-like multicopper oxidase with cupredoxin domain
MIALLLACSPPPGPAIEAEETGLVETGDTGEARDNSLRSPAEAEDLDPAEGSVRIELSAGALRREIWDPASGRVRVVEGYAYNGQVPGPTIRVQKGDVLTVDIRNELDQPTTVHWHGLSVPYEMDGVTWTDEGIPPGGSFQAVFTANEVGTFWYHPHHDSDRQVDLGLYGVVIVEDPAEPAADRELVIVLDADAEDPDTGSTWEDSATGGEDLTHGAHGDASTWLLNGLRSPTLELEVGERIRLRLLNASNTAYAWLDTVGMPVLARDQGLLAQEWSPERLLLAPGDRAELLWLPGPGGEAFQAWPYDRRGGDTQGPVQDLALVALRGDGRAASMSFPHVYEAPTPDPGRTDILWTFQGEEHTDTWMINGEQYPEVTIPVLARGQEAIVEVRNLSATEHPFHLHGMSFEVLSEDGVVPEARLIEDTVNVPIHGAVRLRVLALNPGDWMAHCHILPHAHGGMMTVLRVE